MAVARTRWLPTIVGRRLAHLSRRALLWSMLAGGLGGLAGWAVGEPLNTPDSAKALILVYWDTSIYFAALSLSIGAAFGALAGVLNRSRRQTARGGLIGTLVGGLCGGIGGVPAQYLFNEMGNGTLARAVAWAIVGAAVGLCPGAVTRDRRRAARGVLGGAAGGFLAGLLFDLVSVLVPHSPTDTGTASRFVADLIVGMSIGRAVALVEDVWKAAWLMVAGGRREGARFILSKDVNTIGRDDRDDVLLWGDPLLASTHARIVRRHGRYLLERVAADGAVLVNGADARGPANLRDGDEITVGATRLVFHTRCVPSGGRDIPATASPAYAAIGAGPDGGNPASLGAIAPGVRAGLPPGADVPVAPAPAPASGAVTGARRRVSAPMPAGRPSFRLVEAIPGGRVYRLAAGAGAGNVVSVGRVPENSIVIDDPTVSGRHAELRDEGGRWVVRDLGSTNGTYVGYGGGDPDRRVETNALADGSTVRFGHVTLRLERQPAVV